MAPTLPQFDARRLRSYVFRLPLFTRAVVLIIVGFWIAGLVRNLTQWGGLIPSEIGISTSMSRLLVPLEDNI